MSDTTTTAAAPAAQTDGAALRAEIEAQLRAALAKDAAGKPGWKTSEFWLALVGKAFGIAVGAYGMAHGHTTLVELSMALVGGSQITYTLARVMAKRAGVALPAAPGAPSA
jgi:hypothetical protein